MVRAPMPIPPGSDQQYHGTHRLDAGQLSAVTQYQPIADGGLAGVFRPAIKTIDSDPVGILRPTSRPSALV